MSIFTTEELIVTEPIPISPNYLNVTYTGKYTIVFRKFILVQDSCMHVYLYVRLNACMDVFFSTL